MMNYPLRIKDELVPFPLFIVSDGSTMQRKTQMVNACCIIDSHGIVLVVVKDIRIADKILKMLNNV